MGIGMVLIVAPFYAESILAQLRRAGEEPEVVGRVVPGAREGAIS